MNQAKPVRTGEYRHTQDHKNKKSRLLLVLHGHVMAQWPWLDGILTRKQCIAASLKPETPKPSTAPAPVCLKIGSAKA